MKTNEEKQLDRALNALYLEAPESVVNSVKEYAEKALAAARADVVDGVKSWAAINEVAEPPLDWAGLGEYLKMRGGE